jgi:hypothetical protein
MGKQRTVHGAYSGDFDESSLKVDPNAYYPSKKPNKYVADDGLKGRIFLDIANLHVGYPDQGYGAAMGFSGPVSRNKGKR